MSLWLIVLGIAASPNLHGLLHKDSQSPTHTCVVTQVQQQTFLSSGTLLSVPLPVFFRAEEGRLLHSLPPSTRDLRLADGRAPPVLSTAFTVVG